MTSKRLEQYRASVNNFLKDFEGYTTDCVEADKAHEFADIIADLLARLEIAEEALEYCSSPYLRGLELKPNYEVAKEALAKILSDEEIK